ncbi:Asp-tRNA(Asn)/Glu-tRNA(Gln) amidotransferase subunit GatC [Syntrophomonas curvata]
MPLTTNEVEHVALLARLTLNDKEKKEFAGQLSLILDYANRLNEINTDEIEPLAHILPVYNVFREDIVGASPSRDEILANGPLLEDGQYKVPKIV